MNNDEIFIRLKKHYLFFDLLKEQVEDKRIYTLAKRYMELLFFELIKNNIKIDGKMNSKL
jgi:hypothetical protein